MNCPDRLVGSDVISVRIGSSVAQMDHPYDTVFEATQSILVSQECPATTVNDKANLSHTLAKGSFVTQPSDIVHITDAGQSIVTVNGKSLVTRAGRATTNCEAQPEQALESLIVTTGGLFTVNGAPLLRSR